MQISTLQSITVHRQLPIVAIGTKLTTGLSNSILYNLMSLTLDPAYDAIIKSVVD